ncbi:MAG: metallophosphoesterase family protein [Chloroflexi bacterium]|nr:metallophosphoesterase family protein [Chloroflexota bacterium]
MKLLLFSDLHTDQAATRRLVEKARTADVLVGAGDFASVRRNISACIRILREVTRPTVLVAGNNETTDELREACRGWPSAHVLHGASVTLAGLTFYGIGGGIPVTPFGAWSYDFSEDQAGELLANCPAGCILVSHSPPHGVVDLTPQGKHLGSAAIRDAVMRVQPRLVVCGHIHACGGQKGTLGRTPVINAGPQGMEWHVPE